jgi:hypothetical protein
MYTRSSPAGENQLSRKNRCVLSTGSSFLSKRESILGSFFHRILDSMDSNPSTQGKHSGNCGAGDGDRTRNHRLGKPMLYH